MFEQTLRMVYHHKKIPFDLLKRDFDILINSLHITIFSLEGKYDGDDDVKNCCTFFVMNDANI